MRAGALRFKAEFLKPGDKTLGHSLSYTFAFHRRCNVQEIQYSEQERESLQMAEDIKRFTFRYDKTVSQVDHGWRIRFEGADFNIVRVRNTDRFKKKIEFDVVRLDG